MKKLLYVNNKQGPSNAALECLREIGKLDCEDVYRADNAIEKINNKDYSEVFITDMRLAMSPPLGDYCQNGIEVVRVAREKGLPVLVLHPHTVEMGEETAIKLGKMGATMIHMPASLHEFVPVAQQMFKDSRF